MSDLATQFFFFLQCAHELFHKTIYDFAYVLPLSICFKDIDLSTKFAFGSTKMIHERKKSQFPLNISDISDRLYVQVVDGNNTQFILGDDSTAFSALISLGLMPSDSGSVLMKIADESRKQVGGKSESDQVWKQKFEKPHSDLELDVRLAPVGEDDLLFHNKRVLLVVVVGAILTAVTYMTNADVRLAQICMYSKYINE
jgi:hypothetical protein